MNWCRLVDALGQQVEDPELAVEELRSCIHGVQRSSACGRRGRRGWQNGEYSLCRAGTQRVGTRVGALVVLKLTRVLEGERVPTQRSSASGVCKNHVGAYQARWVAVPLVHGNDATRVYLSRSDCRLREPSMDQVGISNLF